MRTTPDLGPHCSCVCQGLAPRRSPLQVACGTVVAVLQARDKQELYCRLHPAKAALLDVTEDTDGEGVLPGPWKESPAATVEQLGAVVVRCAPPPCPNRYALAELCPRSCLSVLTVPDPGFLSISLLFTC